MEAMIMRGYVPNCVRSIQRLLQQDEQGIPVEDTVWVRSGGRRALLTNEEVDAAVAKIKEEAKKFADENPKSGPYDGELLDEIFQDSDSEFATDREPVIFKLSP